jgi:tetratricopeptide (TPR) repeat protein
MPGGPPAATPLDEAKVQALRQQAEAQPKDAALRAQIGNMYFDAERYPDAISWYEQSLAIDAKNADVSTDLGVSYYYTNQTDRALQQFQKSLDANPRHTKTILNIGMVKAFGKQDLPGAAQAWQQVVEIAPDTPEGRAARQALESLKAAHPDPAPGAAGAVERPAGVPAAATPKGGP